MASATVTGNPPQSSSPYVADPQVFVGSKINIISNSAVRYEGQLYDYNEDDATISLQNVRSYGSEDRLSADKKVQPSQELYEYIIFRVSDIKDLEVSEPPKLDLRSRTRRISNSISSDPAVVKSSASGPPPMSGGMMASSGMGNSVPLWRLVPAAAQSGGSGQPGTNQQQGMRGRGRGRRGRARREWGNRGGPNQGMMNNGTGGGGSWNGQGSGPWNGGSGAGAWNGGAAGGRPGGINSVQHVKLLKEYQNVVPPVPTAQTLDPNMDLDAFSNQAQKFALMDKSGQAIGMPSTAPASSSAEPNSAGNIAMPAPETDPKKYYNPDDGFFDKISCEALDPNQGVNPRNWRRENQLNNNTFGRPPRSNTGNNWNMRGGGLGGQGQGQGRGFGGGGRRGGGRGRGRGGNGGGWMNRSQQGFQQQPGMRQQGGNNGWGNNNNSNTGRNNNANGWGGGGGGSWNQGGSNGGWNGGSAAGGRQGGGGWNQSGGAGAMNNWTHGPVPQQMQMQAPPAGGAPQAPMRGRGGRRGGGAAGGRGWVASLLPEGARGILTQQNMGTQTGGGLGAGLMGETSSDSMFKPVVEWTFPVDKESAAALQAERDGAGSTNKENGDYVLVSGSPDEAER